LKEIEFIETALSQVSDYVREQYARRESLDVATKADATDLLTEADLGVQDRLVEQIRQVFPADAIVAEERGMAGAPDDPDVRCWVIDPIDGTQNFVRGLLPVFGVSLAFAVAGQSVAGGVALPVTDDTFLAERGAGAFHDGRRLHVSNVTSLALARVEVDFATPTERPPTLARVQGLLCATGQIRSSGAAVVDLCSIAAGESDAYFHAGLEPYDYAAGQIILEEAGGRTSRLDGSPLRLFDAKRGVLASNDALHGELIDAVGV